jgi:outer membrane receptor protein involved in Fe transport
MKIITWVGVRKVIQLLGMCSGVLLLCLSAFSQTNTGRILGSVRDQSDAVVGGATISVMDVERGVTRTLVTDSTGEFVAPNLEPGMYQVRVEAQGFKTVSRQNVQLQVAQDVRLDFVLQLGSTSETVTVTEEVPLVNTTSSTLGGTLSNQTINDLPLNGRNFQKLLELRPGTYIFPGGGKWSQSTNGMRAEHNVYILNGIDTIEGFSSQSVLNAAPVFGDATSILPIDAIQEFNTQQNPKAEYGWKPGGILNVGLKSGTNDLHGTAYAFGRSDALDAKNPFITAGNPKQPTAIEDFGGTIGGPIRKGKVFFLAGYEGQRNTIGAPATATLPTRAALGNATQSLLDACNALTTAPKDLSLKLAGLTYGGPGLCAKDPNNAGVFQDGSSTSFLVLPTGHSTLDNVLGKVDYHLSDKHAVSGEYFLGNYTGLGPQGAVVHPYWETNTHSRVQIAGAHWTYVPNSTIVNEVRWGLNRVYQPTYPGDCQNIGQPDFSYMNTGTGNCGFPSTTIGSFTALGCCANFPKIQGPDMTMQFIDALSYLHGRHTFKFGGEMRHLIYNGGTYRGSRGIFSFASLSTFLTGTISGTAQELAGSPQRHVTDWGYAGYAQDDWRLTKRFTLNLGLRYETVTPMKEASNQLANFDPTLGLVQVGKQISEPYHQDWNNFSPRVGFAWDLTGNSKWVVRGGGSIIYVLEGFNVLLSQQGTKAITTGLNTIPTGALLGGLTGPGDINTGTVVFSPSQVAWNIAGPILPSTGVLRCDSPLSASSIANKPCPILAVNPNLRSPYVTAWNLSLQHAFSSNLSLEVAYIGNHGTKLIGIDDINAPKPGSGWFTTSGSGATLTCSPGAAPAATFNATCENLNRSYFSKFPYLSNINLVSNMDESNYNGLQATLTQRPWHGVSYILGYTWSHAFEQNQGDWNVNLVSNPFNPAADYGNASFDVRQRMTMSLTYALPEKKGYAQMLEGWKINSVMNMQTSPPWSVADSTDDISGVGEFNDRWNFFGNPSAFSGLRSNSIPYFSGTSSADCLAKAQALDVASTPLYPGYINVASLTKYGCYELNGAMMLPPAFGTFGTMGRNLFRGNGLRLWDMSLTKQIRFTERFNGQFRFEMFNILNKTQYALPSGPNVTQSNNNPAGGGSGNFGASKLTPDVAIANPQVGSGGARSIQLGLKFIF